ncbi:MAG: MATE family efflux transporter [Clostridia bacterium]|nr:MATE family efflux transporter [Clostridia bacterium]
MLKDNYGLFPNKKLKDMIVPMFFEQLLVMLVGLVDTFVITYAGESAVSGVSLVNQFTTIFMYLFTALASGGAVVISQYIGKKEPGNASKTSGQLLMSSTLISMVIMTVVLIFNRQLMGLMFGKVDSDVMNACLTYLRITAISYPFIAIYNAGASLFRSLGKTSVTMKISIVSNVVNLVLDFICVMVLRWGVAGVAWPTVLARALSAVAITYLAFSKKNPVHFTVNNIFTWDGSLLKKVLSIAVPNGVENGVFQLVKVALSSVVAMFGTYQIAANGVAQSIWSLAAVFGMAMAPVFTTVVGQCMGSGNKDAAAFYIKKLMAINVVLSTLWNGIVLAITPIILSFNNLSEETRHLVLILVIIHNVFNSFALPFSGNLGTGLRAAGDVKYTMLVSIASTVFGRGVLSLIFALVFNMGVIGIAFAMCADWCIRGFVFLLRYKSKKWQNFRVV